MIRGARRALRLLPVVFLAACAQQGLPQEQRATVRCRAAIAYGPDAPPAIRWTTIDDSAGAAVLDAYCAAIGPAIVFAPGPSAATHASTALAAESADRGVDEVAFVAWNIALGGGDVRRFIGDLRAGGHTDGDPPRHFVLLLQEVPRMGAAVPAWADVPDGAILSSHDPVSGPDVLDLARAERLHLLYVPSMREEHDTARIDHGTAILSTLPLSDPRAIELPAGMRRRVVTAARIHVAGQPVHVVSVHLDNFAFRHFAGSFGAVRARQARALASALPPGGAMVLGGDLNTWTRGTDEAAYRVLRVRLPRPDPLQPHATARRLGVPRRLDYLLIDAPAGWAFAERRIDDRYGSDHHALIGVLRQQQRQN